MVNGSTRTRPGFCARPTSRGTCVVALLLAGLVLLELSYAAKAG